MRRAYDAVVIGAGMAGIFTARELVARGATVALLDSAGPMTGTSCLSTEGYRTVWPTVGQAALVASSLDSLGPGVQLHQHGYMFVSRAAGADSDPASVFPHLAHAGEGVRIHRDAAGAASAKQDSGPATRGVDVFLGPAAARAAFPWLGDDVTAAVWHRRAGWMAAHTVGMEALEAARDGAATRDGLHVLRATATAICGSRSGGVTSVAARAATGEDLRLDTGAVVNAAGPAANAVHALLRLDEDENSDGTEGQDGVRRGDLPLYSQVHAKGIVRDTLGAVPRDAPLTIAADAEPLHWDWSGAGGAPPSAAAEAETAAMMEEEMRCALGGRAPSLVGPLPGAAHFRPYGPDALLVLWEHLHSRVETLRLPPRCPVDAGLVATASYAELVLRRLARDVPSLAAYVEPDSEPGRRAVEAAGPGASAFQGRLVVDGGYYTRAPDNLPLVGPGPAPLRSGEPAMSQAEAAAALAAGEVPDPFATEAEAPPGYVLAAGLSGYGIMAGASVGRIAAAWAAGEDVCAGQDLTDLALRAAAPAPVGVDEATALVGAGELDAVLGGMMHPSRFQLRRWREEVLPSMLEAGAGQL